MLWKLKHRLFGWDYIAWRNTADDGVARVHNDGQGATYYWRYPSVKIADRIRDRDQVLWLTCPPEKYLKPNAGTDR